MDERGRDLASGLLLGSQEPARPSILVQLVLTKQLNDLPYSARWPENAVAQATRTGHPPSVPCQACQAPLGR